MSASSRKLSTEQVLEDAEVAAKYFRTLVDKGVPVQAAIALTGSYTSAKMISDRGGEPPAEPWSGGTA